MGRRILFAVVAALALATASWAAERGEGETVTEGKKTGNSQSWHDGTEWHLWGTHNNGPNVTISNPPQGWVYYYPSVIQAAKRPNSAGFPPGVTAVPDSSAVYEAQGATKWIALILPTFDDSTVAVIGGLSIRSHPQQLADSLTTYSLLSNHKRPVNVTLNGAHPRDTLGTLAEMMQNFTYVDSLALPDERVYVLQHGPQPRGRAIMFEFTGDWLSIRNRFLNVVTNASGSGGDQGLRFCGRDPLTTYKVDLYGYR